MANNNLQPSRKGFLGEIVLQVKLVYRLMKDERINFFLKILPFSGLLYLIFPDLLIGPIDDAAILMMGSYLFIEFCPNEVVEEHLRYLRGEQGPPSRKEDVIDAEFRDVH